MTGVTQDLGIIKSAQASAEALMANIDDSAVKVVVTTEEMTGPAHRTPAPR